MTIEQLDEFLHEWHTEEAQRFLKELGISDRNWKIFSRRLGRADGHKWTFGELANAENIARPRAHQIFKRTQEIVQKHIKG